MNDSLRSKSFRPCYRQGGIPTRIGSSDVIPQATLSDFVSVTQGLEKQSKWAPDQQTEPVAGEIFKIYYIQDGKNLAQ